MKPLLCGIKDLLKFLRIRFGLSGMSRLSKQRIHFTLLSPLFLRLRSLIELTTHFKDSTYQRALFGRRLTSTLKSTNRFLKKWKPLLAMGWLKLQVDWLDPSQAQLEIAKVPSIFKISSLSPIVSANSQKNANFRMCLSHSQLSRIRALWVTR